MKRTGAIIACFLALNSALAACAPKTIPDDDTSPRTNAVIGLSKGTISGPCAIGIGPSGSRKIATIVEFATAWPADTQTAAYRSVRLGPGEWDLYQIQCGQFAIDRPAGPRGFTPRSGTFRALATFSVGSQSPIYLGNVELKSAGDDGWQIFGIGLDAQGARKHLARQNATGDRPLELSPLRHVQPDTPGAIRQGITLAVFNPAFGWRLRPRRVRAGSLLQGAGPEVLFPNRFRRPRVPWEHTPRPSTRPTHGHTPPT